jgi:hypothetical protein
MIISVLERRREIGLRRSLGATRRHILIQFLAEALLLSALGGLFGSVFGAAATGIMARINDWPFVLPPAAIVVAVTATLVISAVAGLYPAVRAARENTPHGGLVLVDVLVDVVVDPDELIDPDEPPSNTEREERPTNGKLVVVPA